MKVSIVGDGENPLLGRREVRFTVNYSGPTPKKADVRKQIISILESDEKLTVLDSLKQNFGKTELAGYVKVYKDAESMKVEPEYRLKQNFEVKEKAPEKPEGGEEKPKEEKPKEEKPKEEKPKEEKPKEEKPKEEKPKEEKPKEEKPKEEKPEGKEGKRTPVKEKTKPEEGGEKNE